MSNTDLYHSLYKYIVIHGKLCKIYNQWHDLSTAKIDV